MLVAAGGGILHAKGQISLAAAVVAPGSMVLAMILFLGRGLGRAVILRVRGGDPISHAAGSGVLTPGRLTEKAKLSQDIDKGNVLPPGLNHADPPTNS